ncbi:hypothetical protein K3495_g2935 [Podosphaera aphanis]|nr:hypothetical protein K3495_g2935 [Podosphaera aphanis]
MAEAIRSGNSRVKLGYVDDIEILGIERTTTEPAAVAQGEVNKLHEWASKNAVSFDPEKSEVIQFPGRRGEISISVKVNDTWIEPAENIRWLGIHLDSQLSFKHHVTTRCGKVLKVAQHMRRLNPVTRGSAPGPLLTAVDTCSIPVASFGAEVWLPGSKRPTKHGVVTPTAHLYNLIDKAIRFSFESCSPSMENNTQCSSSQGRRNSARSNTTRGQSLATFSTNKLS